MLAGLAVGVMAVPQCVSFALMAGLPSVYGLYSAFLPVVAYALTGSSPQLVCHLCVQRLPGSPGNMKIADKQDTFAKQGKLPHVLA